LNIKNSKGKGRNPYFTKREEKEGKRGKRRTRTTREDNKRSNCIEEKFKVKISYVTAWRITRNRPKIP
jgi:hypothetical protein